MNFVIVCWNVQGKYYLVQLLDRFLENGWDLMIVLEPSTGMKPPKSLTIPKDLHVDSYDVDGQQIYVVWSESFLTACTGKAVGVMGGERKAVLLDVTTRLGAKYRLLTAHAPYKKGKDHDSATTSQYQNNLLKIAGQKGVDLVIGDLNTYGSRVGSTRGGFRCTSEDIKTSSGGHPLDKAIMRDDFFGLDVSTSAVDLGEVEVPEETYFPGGRTSDRESVKQSRMGRDKRSDHLPLVVTLPLQSLHVKPSSGMAVKPPKEKKEGRTKIAKDGHCLYRCVAQALWGDQNRYQEVRTALANHVRVNWNNYAYTQHLQSVGQIPLFASIVSSTNAWGGEFELAALADCYGLSIHLYSAQGFQQAVYGTGGTHVHVYHDGTHFEVG